MTATPDPSPTPAPHAPHADYRRRARRIRAAFRGQPAQRLRALRVLAEAHDAIRQPLTAHGPVHPLPAGQAAAFGRLVRGRLDGPILRYSHRTALIRHAQRHGIGRFEANLIIAAVQHEARATPARGEPVASRGEPTPSRGGRLPVILGFCAAQSAIVLGVWCLVG